MRKELGRLWDQVDYARQIVQEMEADLFHARREFMKRLKELEYFLPEVIAYLETRRETIHEAD